MGVPLKCSETVSTKILVMIEMNNKAPRVVVLGINKRAEDIN